MAAPPFDVEKHCSARTNAYRSKVAAANPKASPYELELSAFGMAPFGTDVKGELCLNCFRFQWPGFLLLESGEFDNFWAKRMVMAANKWKFLNLLGSASSGKTWVMAAYVYTRWKSMPWATSVYISTTTLESLRVKTWAAVLDLHSKDRYPVGERLDYRHTIVLQEDPRDKDRDYRDALSCVCIETGNEGKKALAAVSGRKNKNVIWVADEMGHMDIGILEARLNPVGSNPFGQFIGLNNRPNEGDPCYIDSEPKGKGFEGGWPSVTPDTLWWTTQAGACHYFDGEKSPNLLAPDDKPPFPGLMTRPMIELIAQAGGGTDSPGYWTQVRAFPGIGEEQGVLGKRLIEANSAHLDPVWGTTQPECIAGLDLGFRKGGDPCVADFAKLGYAVDGTKIVAFEPETVVLQPKISDTRPFETQIAGVFLDECKTRGCHEAAVDISGDGGIIAQAIESEARKRSYKMTLQLISFMGAPSEKAMYEVGGRRQEARELFDRRVSELWYALRFSVQNGVVRGMRAGSRAVQQLCARKAVLDEKKRWSVEKKADMKKRIRRSPDDGDARVLAHFLAVKKGLVGGGKSAAPPRREWKDVMEKPKGEPARYQAPHRKSAAYSRR